MSTHAWVYSSTFSIPLACLMWLRHTVTTPRKSVNANSLLYYMSLLFPDTVVAQRYSHAAHALECIPRHPQRTTDQFHTMIGEGISAKSYTREARRYGKEPMGRRARTNQKSAKKDQGDHCRSDEEAASPTVPSQGEIEFQVIKIARKMAGAPVG